MTTINELMENEDTQELKQQLLNAVYALESEKECDILHDRLMDVLKDNEYAELWLISVFSIYSLIFGALATRRLQFI